MKHFFDGAVREFKNAAVLGAVLILAAALFSIPGQNRLWAQTDGGITDTTTVTTAPSAPAAPAALHATPNMCGSGVIGMSWPSVSGASGYRLSRDATVIYDGTNVTYLDTHLAGGVNYSYSVLAYNAGGSSNGTSVTATAPPPTCATLPAVPTNLMVDGTPTPSSVSLKWTDNATNEDGYVLERKFTTATGYGYITFNLSANTTSYSDTGVTAGTTYDYRVQACLSGTGCSAYANLYGIIVPTSAASGAGAGGSGATAAPPMPAGLSGSSGSCGINSISLGWQAANGAASYKIYRGGNLVYTTTNLGYIDGNLPFSTLYSYAVYAVNSYGSSPAATVTASTSPACSGSSGGSTTATTTVTTSVQTVLNVATTTTMTVSSSSLSTSPKNLLPSWMTVPAAPSNLSLNGLPSGTAISLVWTDNAVNEDRFNIDRKLSSERSYQYLSQLIGANRTTFVDHLVSADTTYDYRVQACLSGTGCSAYVYLSGISTAAGSSTAVRTEAQSSTTDAHMPTVMPFDLKRTVDAAGTPELPHFKMEPATPRVATSTASTSPRQWRQTAASPESASLERVGRTVDATRAAVNGAKQRLVQIVDRNIEQALLAAGPAASTTAGLRTIRGRLLTEIDGNLAGLTTITPDKIEAVQQTVADGLSDIHDAVAAATSTATAGGSPNRAGDVAEVTATLETLSGTIHDQAQALKAEGGDLMYKDSNHDGISDYDSVNVYHIDPDKPSPVSTYQGSTVTAGEKVALGFDPTQAALVKVEPQQPVAVSGSTSAPKVASAYTVDAINLNPDKKVELAGAALPNSYVTIYIYSTPIIVTVKTDGNGQWHYTVDKELDTGTHTIYTATVDNSGKILAQSPGIVFTKTAEAATLDTVPPVRISATVKPALFGNFEIYTLVSIVALIILAVLIIIGHSVHQNSRPSEAQKAEDKQV